ncbi:MAG: hypothetical protein NUW07_06895 [Candidatus Saccharicenans sp.]|jgi:uncharacterized membrane protein (DUF106 family)|nr:hypothetical protein [Candidatus Saccharicenans sp.]
MLWWLNSAVGTIVRVIFLPFSSASPWGALLVISLLTALLLLLVYKKTSNQAGLKQVKNRIKASLLEIRLYQSDFRTQLGSQKELVAANLRYLLYNLQPLLVMLLPIFLLLAQLNLWFGYRAVRPGETFLLKVRFITAVDIERVNLELEAPPGLTVETPPVRIIDLREAAWRLRLEEPVSQPLIIQVNGERYQKEIPRGGRRLSRISTVRVRRNLWQELLYPGEKPLPSDSLLSRIELSYPEQRLELLGLGLHWLLAYFLLSVILGLGLKGFFRVEI